MRTHDGHQAGDAVLHLDCGSARRIGSFPSRWRTDDQGQFEWQRMGCLPKACVLTVEDERRAVQSFRVGDVCHATADLACRPIDYCNQVYLFVTLPESQSERTAPPSTPARPN